MELKFEKENSFELFKEFEEQLINLIEDILTKDAPFSQTEDKTNCSYCSFKNICVR